jgi:hypothetical protein
MLTDFRVGWHSAVVDQVPALVSDTQKRHQRSHNYQINCNYAKRSEGQARAAQGFVVIYLESGH